MPAVITSTGTFSGLDNLNPTSQGPGASVNEVLRQQGGGFPGGNVEQRFQPRALDYSGAYTDDVDGMQEVMQFVGIFAAAYGIGASAAVRRIADILTKAFTNTADLTDRRVYTP